MRCSSFIFAFVSWIRGRFSKCYWPFSDGALHPACGDLLPDCGPRGV